mgnify:FL=1
MHDSGVFSLLGFLICGILWRSIPYLSTVDGFLLFSLLLEDV